MHWVRTHHIEICERKAGRIKREATCLNLKEMAAFGLLIKSASSVASFLGVVLLIEKKTQALEGRKNRRKWENSTLIFPPDERKDFLKIFGLIAVSVGGFWLSGKFTSATEQSRRKNRNKPAAPDDENEAIPSHSEAKPVTDFQEATNNSISSDREVIIKNNSALPSNSTEKQIEDSVTQDGNSVSLRPPEKETNFFEEFHDAQTELPSEPATPKFGKSRKTKSHSNFKIRSGPNEINTFAYLSQQVESYVLWKNYTKLKGFNELSEKKVNIFQKLEEDISNLLLLAKSSQSEMAATLSSIKCQEEEEETNPENISTDSNFFGVELSDQEEG